MTDQTINAPSLTEYSSLGSYLQSFSDITQIDALFYSLTGVLVHNNNVYSDDKIIQSELDVNKIVKYTIFPIILDSKLLGFVLCNCDNVSQQRVKLSKEYLNNIFTQVFDEEGSGKQVVLDALSNEQFGQINYLSILLKLSFRYSNVVEEQVDKQVTASSEASKSLKKAIDYILKNINKSFSLNDLADKVYLSPSYLSRLFKKDLHITFIDYVNHLKVAKAKEKLALTNQPVSSIALSVGFSQTSYFTKTFKKMAKNYAIKISRSI
ncbi:helix-turn-helix transcriptional regulator [Lentilactobacillus kosonis]|uniref:HTH araC/xylS-type domain-containing protein n=1 Tax=Lentilactobacillus kosonis TaxID=2810561 RepID=A0A401FMP1_9LACO|nr:AraC family transcriptional regulator [Lentilactobacillus kosonis]GAY73603.1 hypothetical protein NBRC111893_1749 [Lentilactobacillus kosonis]